MKYRKRPVVIEAWTVKELNRAASSDWSLLPECIRKAYDRGGWVFGAVVDGRRGIYVPTLEGPLFAAPDDLIICGIKGEFYPCKPDAFEATYEPAEEP
jgi:hypothetical protein